MGLSSQTPSFQLSEPYLVAACLWIQEAHATHLCTYCEGLMFGWLQFRFGGRSFISSHAKWAAWFVFSSSGRLWHTSHKIKQSITDDANHGTNANDDDAAERSINWERSDKFGANHLVHCQSFVQLNVSMHETMGDRHAPDLLRNHMLNG